ncbi:MAG TPA: DUF6221 family protein, partial [Micromonospora sp.]|nr:DUF6221 family protein [Micromonospora sp.]
GGAVTRSAPKMRLASGPRVPVTVAEWDVTPGLHEWIEGEIKRREEAAQAATPGPWEGVVDHHQRGIVEASVWADSISYYVTEKISSGDRHEADAKHIALNGPDSVLRRCAADRKILALHPYTHAPSKHGPGFYCDTCHVEDGVIEGGGNCDTILALAEAYGLDPAGEIDVEVVRE